MPPTSRELLGIQLETLLTFDLAGRILPPGPRVFVSVCREARLVRVRNDVPGSIAESWLTSDDANLRSLVEAHAPITNEYRGPAFSLPRFVPDDHHSIPMTPAVPIHPELVALGWKHDEQPPYFGVIRDGKAVSLCYSARSGPRAAEAGVETAPAYRGQGLVVHAVRAWAAAVQASSRLALYSTQWTNDASRRVAAKLGATEYGENWHLT